MRSILARIIAGVAALSAIPALMEFAQRTRSEFLIDGVPVSGGAMFILGDALFGPVSLFAFAAAIEMLFRIWQDMPRTDSVWRAASASDPAPFWPLRSTIAKLLLIIAAGVYVVSFWAVIQFALGGGPAGMPIPPQDSLRATVSMLFYWFTAPVDIIAWAAVIEYLSRIAAALQKRNGAADAEQTADSR